MTSSPRAQAPGGPRSVPWVRRRAPRIALAPGFVLLALACGSSRAAVEPDDPEDPFSGERAWAHLETIVAFGERPSGSRKIQRLREYIEGELEALDLKPVRESFREETPIGPIEFGNVYVEIDGNDGEREAPVIVLATHFDTKRGLSSEFVGANDGGSGTAVLLELARCLALETEPRGVTYRLLFLDGEESVRPSWSGTDNCYGSRHHVREAKRRGELERMAACVVVDMVGDRDLVLTHERYSDPRLLGLFFAAAHKIGLGDHVGARPREIKDDHLSFLNEGIPSVDLIDFEYGPGNDYWHHPDDRLDKCSAESLQIIGRILWAGLPQLERFAGR